MIKKKDGVPYSTIYDDIYYSRENGLAEARYIFLDGNNLTERLKSDRSITIVECGFGTGLNFLATCEQLTSSPSRATPPHYISIEKHPFSQQELEQIHSTFLKQFPELTVHSEQLLKFYPVSCTGLHRICLTYVNINLDLYFLDIESALAQIQNRVDAWFLDGFAPGKNPAMWTQDIFHRMANLSHENTTVATFTAAGAVQRGLRDAGFKIKKISGFGKKRENLTARFQGNTTVQIKSIQPWFRHTQNQHKHNSATIIGAGIAGCQVAHHLARRGWKITIIEEETGIAQRASGNPVGVVSPKISLSDNIGEHFYVQGFQYLLNQLVELNVDDDIWMPCGVVKLLHKENDAKRWQDFHQHSHAGSLFECITAKQASELSGVPVDSHGLFFPSAGYLSPCLFCERLLRYGDITRCLQTSVKRIQNIDNAWHTFDKQNNLICQSDVVVLTTGHPAPIIDTINAEHFPHALVRGQSSIVDATEATRSLATVIDHNGYVTPTTAGKHHFGASYQIHDTSVAARLQENDNNFKILCDRLPVFTDAKSTVDTAYTALRTTTPDRFPYVGAVPDFEFYQQAYADLHHGKHWKIYEDAQYEPGLFLATGFGSRGLTTSALCAEMLTSLINNEPLPMQTSLTAALHPARFFIKQMKQARTKKRSKVSLS